MSTWLLTCGFAAPNESHATVFVGRINENNENEKNVATATQRDGVLLVQWLKLHATRLACVASNASRTQDELK